MNVYFISIYNIFCFLSFSNRIKSGNPGYFVAYNPGDSNVTSDFSKIVGMPEQLTVLKTSQNYNVTGIAEK